jgi:hypothetical protein
MVSGRKLPMRKADKLYVLCDVTVRDRFCGWHISLTDEQRP